MDPQIKFMLLWFLGLWFGGVSLAEFAREGNPTLISIPGWLCRFLFLRKFKDVPLPFLIYQVWIYLIFILSIIAYLAHLFSNIVVIYYKLVIATILVLAVYSFFVVLKDFLMSRGGKMY